MGNQAQGRDELRPPTEEQAQRDEALAGREIPPEEDDDCGHAAWLDFEPIEERIAEEHPAKQLTD